MTLAINPALKTKVAAALEVAVEQVKANREEFRHIYPRDNTVNNVYPPTALRDFAHGLNVSWTTGMWTGQVWLSYELSGDEGFRSVAEDHVKNFTQRLADRVDVDHHDIGFLYTPSCTAAYRITGSELGKETALKAADVLMERYLANVGVIQAWGDLNDPEQQGRIIIDCLMNLPLLRWATEITGNTKYRDAADSHALRAREVLVRPDFSTYHTYHFDPVTGAALRGTTHQGFADDSCWSRGQAWGIYGFALNHRYAPQLNLLETAIKLADYFLAHLPENGVAYWDLCFGDGSGEPWDSSASAIAACGLLELSEQLPEGEQRDYYHAAALRLIEGLIDTCAGHQPETKALLLHGVYHRKDKLGVDEANLWGDYFYLEALARVDRNWKPYW
jgi:unsaturated chondroitin disaccharide hydrolase